MPNTDLANYCPTHGDHAFSMPCPECARDLRRAAAEEADPFLAWATRDLAKRSGITLEEARKIIVATYVTDAAPSRDEIEEGCR